MKLLGFLVLSLASAKLVVEYVTVTAFVTMKKEQLGAASAGIDNVWDSAGTSSTLIPVAAAEVEAQASESSAQTLILEVPETATQSASKTLLSQTELAQTPQAQTLSTQSTQSAVQTQISAQSQAPASLSSAQLAASASLSSETYSGDGTYYAPGMGACGETSSESDYIVAISKDLFDQYTPDGNPNHNTLCGKKIQAYYEGKSVDVTVVDRCEGCAYGSLDFSPTAFSQLADESLGRIKITWNWV